MMPGKSQTPALRFAGFTGEWVERKFCEICIRVSSVGSDDFLPRVEYEDIISGSGRLNKIFYSKKSSKTGIEFEPGDVLYGKLRPYLRNWLIADFRGIAVGDFWILRPNDTESDFLYMLIQCSQFSKITNCSTGTKMPRADWRLVSSTSFAVPQSTTEQSAIGRFFRKVDALISQQQKKVEKLQGLKKGLMKKMFPRGGCTLPEVRFAGFDEEWVEKKVKEVCSISTGKSNTQDRACDGKYPFYVRSAVIERSHKYLYDEEAVLTVGDGAIGKIFHYVNGKYDLHQRVYRMYDFSEIDARFFYYIFSKDFGKRANSMTAKTSVDSVRMEMIADMEFAMPEKAEQSAIGSLFRKLDDLITLHGEKLEKLRHVKQALLGKMFV